MKRLRKNKKLRFKELPNYSRFGDFVRKIKRTLSRKKDVK
jgi:hypothetical protein